MNKAARLVAHSDGQAVKVCWVIKGYALNTVPVLLVTCRQLRTPCVYVCVLTRICPPGSLQQYGEKFGLIGDQNAACFFQSSLSTCSFRGAL